MKINRPFVLCALYINFFCLAGCDKPAQKEAKAEQEATKKGMQGNPGDYTPAPLNTSMTPRATPKPTEPEK